MRPQLQWIWKQTNSFNRQFGESLLTARCLLLLTGSILSWIMTGEWGWSKGILYVRKSEEGLRESENAAKIQSTTRSFFTVPYLYSFISPSCFFFLFFGSRLLVLNWHLQAKTRCQSLQSRQNTRYAEQTRYYGAYANTTATATKPAKTQGTGFAKQQLCTFITLFCTFLCRRCKYTTWNFLISRSVEDVNTRQRISISFSEFAYGAFEFNSREMYQNLTNWTWWNKRVLVWTS